jgi:hypothetical protein
MFGTELITTRLRGFALIALRGELDQGEDQDDCG